ncbi:conserved hypothetical protein [Burkholderia cepacia]
MNHKGINFCHTFDGNSTSLLNRQRMVGWLEFDVGTNSIVTQVNPSFKIHGVGIWF